MQLASCSYYICSSSNAPCHNLLVDKLVPSKYHKHKALSSTDYNLNWLKSTMNCCTFSWSRAELCVVGIEFQSLSLTTFFVLIAFSECNMSFIISSCDTYFWSFTLVLSLDMNYVELLIWLEPKKVAVCGGRGQLSSTVSQCNFMNVFVIDCDVLCCSLLLPVGS